MIPPIPASWRPVVGGEAEKPYFQALRQFVETEQAKALVLPPERDIFAAMELTPYERVSVLLLGQDPYPTPGHAQGLAFSVRPGVAPPASLRNMFKELQSDLGYPPPKHNGSLVPWARQGVLLLNTVLTVRAGEANSHKGKGWEKFTDEVIRKVSGEKKPVVFLLWGKPAQTKVKLIDEDRHVIVKSAHPSPLSAHNGFFGSKPYSTVNAALGKLGRPKIDWQIEDVPPA